jgi:hypothetical protein
MLVLSRCTLFLDGLAPVLSSVTSFHVMFGHSKPKCFDHLDHERDITLAIHAAIPDLIGNADRDVIQADSGWSSLFSEPVRMELTGEAGLAGKDTNLITAARRRYQGPFDDR